LLADMARTIDYNSGDRLIIAIGATGLRCMARYLDAHTVLVRAVFWKDFSGISHARDSQYSASPRVRY